MSILAANGFNTDDILITIMAVFLFLAVVGFIVGGIKYSKDRRRDNITIRDFNLNEFFNYINIAALICFIVAVVVIIIMLSFGNLNF